MPMALGVQTPQINGVQNFNASQQAATAQASEQQAQKRAAYQALAENALGLMGGRLDGEVNPEHFAQFKQMLADSGNPLADKLTPELVPVIARGSLSVIQAGQDQARLDLAEQQFQLELDKFNKPVEPEAPKVETVFDEATGREKKVQWNPATRAWEDVGGVEATDGGDAPPSDIRVYEYYAEQEKAAGREPLPYINFQQALKAQGLSVTTNPDGTVSITQGGAQKPLTEGQCKDVVFVTRASGALPIVDALGEKLTSFGENVAGKVPYGEYLQSEEYQKADQAGREFLSAILRKDTGAAVTPPELEVYGKTYLPQPGDKPGVLAQKKAARARAVKAIELGLPPAAILSLETEGVEIPDLPNPDASPDAGPAIPKAGDVEDGYRFKGGDPSDQSNWEAVN